MANQTLASLAITMRANAAELVQEVQTARRSLSGLGDMMKGLVSAGAAAGTAIGAITIAQANSIRETKLWADQLGISTQRLMELSAVFQQNANVDGDQFNDMLQELNVRLGEAALTGGGPLVEAFEALGLKFEDVQKMKTDEMLLQIADAFAAMDDKQTLAFASAEIFAGEAEKIVQVLKQGRGPIEAMTQEFRALNGVISDEEARKTAEFATGMKKIKTAFSGLATELTIFLAGPGADAANWLTQLIKDVRQFDDALNKSNISAEILAITKNIDPLIDELKGLEEVKQLVPLSDDDRARIQEIRKEIKGYQDQIFDLREQSSKILPGVTDADREAHEKKMEQAREFHEQSLQFMQEQAAAKRQLEEESEARKKEMQETFGGDPEEIFARMQEAHMTELELLDKNFEEKRALFDKFREHEIGTEKSRNKLMLDEHFKYFAQRRKLEEAANKDNISDKKRFMNHVLQNTKAGGKILLAQQKYQAIQEALIDSKKSIISAYRWGNSIGGPVVGAAFAATAAAVSASMIADIINPGGGSSASTGGGGGAPSAPDVTPPGLEDVAAANDEPQTTKTITVSFEGEGELVPRSVLRELAEELNSLDDSNVRISI